MSSTYQTHAKYLTNYVLWWGTVCFFFFFFREEEKEKRGSGQTSSLLPTENIKRAKICNGL